MTKTIETAESYTELEFPFDIPETSITAATRLFAAIGDKVFGVRWYGDTIETAWTYTSRVWRGDGLWDVEDARRGYDDHMHLPVLPMFVMREISRLEELADELRTRLAEYPDAPAEWRVGDERRLKNIENQIAALSPKPDDQVGESDVDQGVTC